MSAADVVEDVWCCRECHALARCDLHPDPCACRFETDTT
jgi:hypothetical protein